MPNPPPAGTRQAVAGIAHSAGQFLVIRRSATVRSPLHYCFPGGGVERGEAEHEAVIRELEEELSLSVVPVRKLWQSQTASGFLVHWWEMELVNPHAIAANPEEVDSFGWYSFSQMKNLSPLLPTNIEFLVAVERQEVILPGWNGDARSR